MKIKTVIVCLFITTFPLWADPLYTVTVRGLNKDFPVIAWQMIYRITAATQADAELIAIENAKRDGCEAASAHIVSTTVTLTPETNRPSPAVIIVNPPPPKEEPPHIEYQEAYQAGYDHGITGFITGTGAILLNAEIPEKYRLAEQGQAYKNGYARGYADEQAKTEKTKGPTQRRQPAPPPARPHSNIGGAQNLGNVYR